MTPYERVKLSRQRTDGAFPLPSPVDCIRYGLCEIAEYDDALLRLERAGDKRNNDRQHDPAAELGQAFYMLLSACVQGQIEPVYSKPTLLPRSRTGRYSIVVIAFSTLLSNLSLQLVFKQHYNDAYSTAVALAAHHGWDVAELVEDACGKFEAQHAPEVQP